MKYLIIPILLTVILLAGCTSPDTTVPEGSTVSTTIATTVETTVEETTTTALEINGTTTIRLGESCTDTDGGKVYDVDGTVTNSRSPTGLTRARDNCVSNVTLNEYFCNKIEGSSYDYEIASEQHQCEVRCFNRVCVNQTS